MKEITIRIGGKEHKKIYPTIDDWVNALRHGEAAREQGGAVGEETLDSILEVVAGAFGVSARALREENNLAEVMQAWRDLNENLLEAFTGVAPQKNA